MKLTLTIAASALIAFILPAASQQTPGHDMQEHGSVLGSPGASGYAPGHTMDRKDSDDKLTTGRSESRDMDRDRDRDSDRKPDRDDVR